MVFVGPYEHHSNELPWRESIADVVVIDEDTDGHIDLARLEEQLVRHADRPLRIGSFSAASNVTGILTDTDRIARLLHAHGALSSRSASETTPMTRPSPTRTGRALTFHLSMVWTISLNGASRPTATTVWVITSLTMCGVPCIGSS